MTLYRDGNISRASVDALKAGVTKTEIIKTLNKSTGNISARATEFNENNWGAVMNDYLTTIRAQLSDLKKWDVVLKAAMVYAKKVPENDRPTEEGATERAFLVDDESDGDDY